MELEELEEEQEVRYFFFTRVWGISLSSGGARAGSTNSVVDFGKIVVLEKFFLLNSFFSRGWVSFRGMDKFNLLYQ